jgi:hypothetical protein
MRNRDDLFPPNLGLTQASDATPPPPANDDGPETDPGYFLRMVEYYAFDRIEAAEKRLAKIEKMLLRKTPRVGP